MSIRGTQIQRDGHGKCDLLPDRIFYSDRAELPAFGVRAHTGTVLYTAWSFAVTSDREVPPLPDCTDRKPFHVTRARCRIVCRYPSNCPLSKGGHYVVSLQHP